MALWVEKATDNIILAAREEFMRYGYLDASIRRIADKANTSAKSIYTRFSNKEGLFEYFVKEQAEFFINGVAKNLTEFSSHTREDQINSRKENGNDLSNSLLEYVYDNFDALYLIICKSKGTHYEGFIEQLATLETEYTLKYMTTIETEKTGLPKITEEFVHMMSRSFFEGFFEMVRHKFDREKAREHIKKLLLFHNSGWEKFLF